MATFAVDLKRYADKLKANLDYVVRRSTFELFTKVVLRSPVDTGRFRANWNCSFGTPDTSYAWRFRGGERGFQEAQKALTMPVGGIVWLSNGLPYAEALETGHSQQAPNGMVRVSIKEFADHVRTIIAK